KVWLRDLGRCAFVAATGRRCDERAFLEFHHVEPHALGGETTLANIELRCRNHNAYEARLLFGHGNGGAGSVRERKASYRSHCPGEHRMPCDTRLGGAALVSGSRPGPRPDPGREGRGGKPYRFPTAAARISSRQRSRTTSQRYSAST